ncbi:MAG: hypothetical protein OCD76_18140 [Reichenbachiella sp.]
MLIWNTQNGISERTLYRDQYWSTITPPPTPSFKSTNEPGEIMFHYITSQSKSGSKYAAVYALNTKSGIIERYVFHKKKWKKSKIKLPSENFGSIQNSAGTIQANFHESKSPISRKILKVIVFWNTKTGTSVKYVEKKKKWIRSRYQLPNAHLKSGETTGEIMLSYSVLAAKSNKLYQVALFWNSKTGESERFIFKNQKWLPSNFNLPPQPIPSMSGAVGEIMMEYSEYLPTKKGFGKSYPRKSVLVWNTKTGVSTEYLFKDKAWIAKNVTLPRDAILVQSGAVGDIMAQYNGVGRASKSYTVLVMWNTKTGAMTRFYYHKGKWNVSDIAFPKPSISFGSASGTLMIDYIEKYH